MSVTTLTRLFALTLFFYSCTLQTEKYYFPQSIGVVLLIFAMFATFDNGVFRKSSK
jgi:hypothetical protein